MYRLIYPAMFGVLFVCTHNYTSHRVDVQAGQLQVAKPEATQGRQFDDFLSEFTRQNVTVAEQLAMIHQLGKQPENREGIRFLVRVLEYAVPDPEVRVGAIWFSGTEIPEPYWPARSALTEIGVPAAPYLVEEFIAFHGKTRYQDLPHHFTIHSTDTRGRITEEQSTVLRQAHIAIAITSNEALTEAVIGYTVARRGYFPPGHPTRQACDRLLWFIRGGVHKFSDPERFVKILSDLLK